VNPPEESFESHLSSRRANPFLVAALLVATVALIGAAVWTAAHATAARTDVAQAQVLGRRLVAIKQRTQNDLATMKVEQASIERLTARHEELSRIRKAKRRRVAIDRARHRHGGQTTGSSG
jgi:hypothetical protein